MQMLILADAVAVVAMAIAIYWFWSSTPHGLQISHYDRIDIIVENGQFNPSDIYLTVNQPAILRFLRKDSDCDAGTVTVQGFKTVFQLPLNEPFELEFTPDEVGELCISSQSNRYRGRIIVAT